jgi:acetyltransferase-like isoleucine patch superfamily enzyme
MYRNIRNLIHLFHVLQDRVSVTLYSKIALFKFKVISAKVGKNIRINGPIYVRAHANSKLVIGDNFNLNSRFASNLVGLTNYAIFQMIGDSKINIGNNCGFSSSVISCRSRISIGNYVMMGGNVRLFDHDYHSLNYVYRSQTKLDGQNGDYLFFL